MKILLHIFFLFLVISQVGAQGRQPLGRDVNSSVSSISAQGNAISKSNVVSMNDNFQVYPSPFKTSFTIEYIQDDVIKSITLVNILGKKVPFVVDHLTNKLVLTLDSGVPDGIYLCRLTMDKEIKTFRVVKSSR